MIKKLINLVKNYDIIMEMVANYKVVNKIDKKKSYSTLNTPKDQLKAIEKLRRGE